MRTIRSSWVLLLITGLLAAGCTGTVPFGGLRGSGDLITESRTVSGFDEIVVLGSGTVIVDVTGSESLEVEAEDNLMEFLTTEVVGGRLELGFESGRLLSPRRDITYTITAAQLNGVTIRGSGDIDASNIDTDTFEVDISGSGNVTPVGTSDHLEVTISGSGRFDGTDLESATGKVQVSGSGNVVVNVTNDLEATISGSGDVKYLGDPNLRATSPASDADASPTPPVSTLRLSSGVAPGRVVTTDPLNGGVASSRRGNGSVWFA